MHVVSCMSHEDTLLNKVNMAKKCTDTVQFHLYKLFRLVKFPKRKQRHSSQIWFSKLLCDLGFILKRKEKELSGCGVTLLIPALRKQR